MKRILKWILGITLLAIAIIAVVISFIPREPEYEGRPLNEWVADLNDPKRQVKAEKAIRAMGPRAVPFLKDSLEQRRSAAVRFYRSNAMAQKWLRGWREKLKWHAPVMESRNAATALGTLGPQAEAAAPNLIAALSDDSPLVAQSASMALGRMGPSVIPLVTERFRYAPTNDTVWAIRALRFMGTNALPAARVTARLLPYPLSIGDEASLTLAYMGPGALPEITNALKDTNTAIRSRAIMAITILGPRGIPATNALREAVHDTDPMIRTQASRALSNIAIYLPQ